MDPREREAKEARERQRQQLLDRAYDQVVAKQLEKIGAKKTFTGEIYADIATKASSLIIFNVSSLSNFSKPLVNTLQMHTGYVSSFDFRG